MAIFGIVWALWCVGVEASCSELHEEKLAVYPTAGVAFSEPRGWLEQLKDKGKTVARWISPDSKPGKPTAMIMIECGNDAGRFSRRSRSRSGAELPRRRRRPTGFAGRDACPSNHRDE